MVWTSSRYKCFFYLEGFPNVLGHKNQKISRKLGHKETDYLRQKVEQILSNKYVIATYSVPNDDHWQQTNKPKHNP